MARRSLSNLVLLWLGTSMVLMVAGGAVWFELAGGSGFFSRGPAYSIGALTMGIWSVCIALPHLLTMVYWAKAIGSSERTRLGLLGRMLVFALPQATLYAMIMGIHGFLMAYVTGTLALWLPRAIIPPLGPGAFARDAGPYG